MRQTRCRTNPADDFVGFYISTVLASWLSPLITYRVVAEQWISQTHVLALG